MNSSWFYHSERWRRIIHKDDIRMLSFSDAKLAFLTKNVPIKNHFSKVNTVCNYLCDKVNL